MGKKPFEERKIKATGLVLPKKDFKLFCELDGYGYDAEKMDEIVKRAEALLDEEIPLLPLSKYREFSITGNRTHYQNLAAKRKTMASLFTLAEHYEKKGRFTEKLADVLWAMMEESTWINPAHNYNTPNPSDTSVPCTYGDAMHGIALCSAGRATALALAYQLLKDELAEISPVIPDKMLYMLNERIIKPFLTCTFWWMGLTKRRTNNWCPWIVSNVLYITAVTVEDERTRTAVVEKSLRCLDAYTEGLPDDGGCDEGPGYWGKAGGSLFDCLELIYDMTGGKIDIFDHPFVKAVGEYIAKVNICGKYFVNFADGSPRCDHEGSFLIRYGTKVGSEEMVTLGKSLASEYSWNVEFSAMYRVLRYLNCPRPAEGATLVAKECTLLKELKVMVARETTDPALGTLIALKGGHNSESHNHNDLGNFIIYKDGRPVLIDAGVGTYTKQTFSPDRYKIWSMQSGYHNLPSFGGVDQKNGAVYVSTDEIFDVEGKSAEMELKNAYPAESGLKTYRRAFRLEGGRATITDRFELDEKKEVIFHFLTHVKPEEDGEGRLRLAEGMTLSYAPSLSPTVEQMDPRGYDQMGKWGAEYLYRISLSCEVSEGSYSFIVE